jgi:hypothetical protein
LHGAEDFEVVIGGVPNGTPPNAKHPYSGFASGFQGDLQISDRTVPVAYR